MKWEQIQSLLPTWKDSTSLNRSTIIERICAPSIAYFMSFIACVVTKLSRYE